jgi:hypothetical protein
MKRCALARRLFKILSGSELKLVMNPYEKYLQKAGEILHTVA